MNQLAAMQMNSICTPQVMLQIFTQLQVLQTESGTIWKHCNVTIEDLTKQVHRCQRDRKRCRQMEEELLDEKDTLQLKFLNALEKNTELDGFLQQQKEHTALISTEIRNLRESMQKVQKELENTIEELNKYKEIAKNKEEEATKANKLIHEMEQELNAGKEQSELCNILADIAIESEGNNNTPKALEANNAVHKLQQATEAVNNLKNLKTEMYNVSNSLEAIINERDQLKKTLQEKEITLSRVTEENASMSKEINTKQSKITSLSGENQQLQSQLQEEKAKSRSLQQEIVELKKKSATIEQVQDILKGRTLSEALLDAATRGIVSEIEALLNAGADIEATDDKKRTPLILAAMKGHIEACKFLLQKGANLEATAAGWYNNTPFLAAVIYSENLDAVKFLINAGANIHAKDSLGTNAFQKDAINSTIRQWLANNRPSR